MPKPGWLWLLLVLLLVPGSSQAESDFARFNKQGEQAYQDGNYAEAAKLLAQAYAIKPVPALLFNIARAYERAGDDEQAIRYYRRYLDAQGTEPETVTKAARALDLLRTRQADQKLAQERADREKADKDRADKDRLAQEQADKDRAAREKAEADAKAAQAAQGGSVGQKTPPPPVVERPSLVPGAALLGGGAVVALVGAGFGISAKGQADAFNQTYDRTQRPALRDSALFRAHVADACYGAGIIAGGIGTYLLVRSLTFHATAPEGAPSALLFDRGAGLAWSGAW
jgi:tetratricopeptide (TPR) repeat protein